MKKYRALCLFSVIAVVAACTDKQPPDSVGTSSTSVISAGDLISNATLERDVYRRYLSARELPELRAIVDKPEVQQELILDYHSDRVLAEHAESLGIGNLDIIRERIARSARKILINGLVDKITEEMQYPSEAQLEDLAHEHYLRHERSFRFEERRRVAHILLKDQSNCPCDIPSVEERLEMVEARLEAGDDFAELAREFSDDPGTAEQGGELPTLAEQNGKLIKNFELAVFDLQEEGELSRPFKTNFGVHIVKLLEILPGRKIPFEEVREDLIEQMKKNLLTSELEKIRANAYPRLDSLNLDMLNEVVRELVEQKKADQGS